ncbi:MAG: F0F1 ATP synthase subunit gamma, partial [Gammaproteobacteria bacterium]|nr:F0F1 ATP synthase subunit gamma [Gammaproteobacteria bacterium]
QSFEMSTHVGGVLGIARRVTEYLQSASRAEVLFAGYQGGGRIELQHRVILPLDPSLLRRIPSGAPALHHLPPAVLLARLGGEYLLAGVTLAIMESLVSENAARLQMMERADSNIDDKLQTLGRLENTLRQEAITSELLDIVSGTEAILRGEAAG